MSTTRSTCAVRHASSRLANQAVLVTGRNRSGRGANSTPAKWTTVSTPATAGASDAGSARSARTTCVRGRRFRSSRTSVRCTMRRRSCSLPASRSARRSPRLPAAPVMRMVRAVILLSCAVVPPDALAGAPRSPRDAIASSLVSREPFHREWLTMPGIHGADSQVLRSFAAWRPQAPARRRGSRPADATTHRSPS